MKNAICMLLLTQSTPLIFMGDEFGNSQKGNNNPYCQDNAITWLDWRLVSKNARILEFWKKMMSFRKAHPILHPDKELRLMDYIACGYPDLSYHGQSAWRPRQTGIFGISESCCAENMPEWTEIRRMLLYIWPLTCIGKAISLLCPDCPGG